MAKTDAKAKRRSALGEDEYKRAVEILRREPNELEESIFLAMWSEHCSYKSSRAWLKLFPMESKRSLVGPGENAGALDIGDGYAAVFKIESHNHPSYIEPYQGAATGVGGILRDILALGARPVATLNSLSFGAVGAERVSYLINGVVGGIAGYGNSVGVPTIGGATRFDASYNGNCLVNVFNLGITRAEKIFCARAEGVGNRLIYYGARTGRDGIAGAQMASESFDDGESSDRPTVQVGDPFREKALIEASLELFKSGALIGIQDMGAAGLTSSSFEMAARAGSGARINLSAVPTREPGMTPREMMLSESQERMLLVVRPEDVARTKSILKKWGLEAEDIGEVTDTGSVELIYDGEIVADLPAAELSSKAPIYHRPYKESPEAARRRELDIDSIPEPTDYEASLIALLASPDLCSKEFIWRQYDHMVRTDTIERPGSDAAMIRIKGTSKAIAMSLDCNSRYCLLDPYEGAKQAVAEALINVAASGAEPIGLTNCLNFGDPEREEIMYQLVRAIEGIAEAARALEAPVVSGNVSLYNQTGQVAINPTPVIGAVGLLENVDKKVDSFFKRAGSKIVLIGRTRAELGGSAYLSELSGMIRGEPPRVDLKRVAALIGLARELVDAELVESIKDISEGGLLCALARSAFARDDDESSFGFSVATEGVGRADFYLFSESQARLIVSTDSARVDAVCARARSRGLESALIGEVTDSRVTVERNGARLIDTSIEKLYRPWRDAFEEMISNTPRS